MEYRINVTSFRYIGEKPYRFKASDFRIYTLNKGDVITLENNHYAHFLRQKSDFVEQEKKQERTKAKQKELEAQEQAPAETTHTKEQEAQEPQGA